MGEVVAGGIIIIACLQLFQQIINQDVEPKRSNRRYRK